MFSKNQRLAVAITLAVGTANLICILFCLFAPKFSLDLMAALLHLSSAQAFASYMQITLRIAVSSMVQSMAYTYLFVHLCMWFHGKLGK